MILSFAILLKTDEKQRRIASKLVVPHACPLDILYVGAYESLL